jgi:DNA-directed RNA polymerase specialized sigma subunit
MRWKRDYFASTVHVPRSAKETYFRYVKIQDSMPIEEICKTLKLSLPELSEIINCMHYGTASLNVVVRTKRDSGYVTIEDQISDSMILRMF